MCVLCLFRFVKLFKKKKKKKNPPLRESCGSILALVSNTQFLFTRKICILERM